VTILEKTGRMCDGPSLARTARVARADPQFRSLFTARCLAALPTTTGVLQYYCRFTTMIRSAPSFSATSCAAIPCLYSSRASNALFTAC
jgi:hypothetical protein